MANPSDEPSFRERLKAQAAQYEKQLDDLRRRPARLTEELNAANSEIARLRGEQELLEARLAAGIERREGMLHLLAAMLQIHDEALPGPECAELLKRVIFQARGYVSAELLARQGRKERAA